MGLELKFTYRIHAIAEVYIKLVAQNTVVRRSRDLNSQSRGIFSEWLNNVDDPDIRQKPTPIATVDNEFSFYLPIGLILTF
jgi:uncharacterized protein YfaT (DUF1175 family)